MNLVYNCFWKTINTFTPHAWQNNMAVEMDYEKKRIQKSLHLDEEAIQIIESEHARTKKSQSQIVNDAIYQMQKRDTLIAEIVGRIVSESLACLWGNAEKEIRRAISGQNEIIRQMFQEECCKNNCNRTKKELRRHK